MDPSATTFIEALASSLEAASSYNPNDADKPAAVLWTDRESQWQPIVPHLRRFMPQLLTLGEYEPGGPHQAVDLAAMRDR